MHEKKKTRGPNNDAPWVRPTDLGVVLRLALDVGDPMQRSLLDGMFAAAFAVRRALQRDARSRSRAYWAARHERARREPAAVRERLRLSRTDLEHAAYTHLDAAPHLRRFVTKALAMHVADSVWSATQRNLFRDARGKRQGLLHVGRWFDFARLPGRARSHELPRKWETFRLHGTLAAHRAAYTDERGRFFQPRVMRPIAQPAGRGRWWKHDGPLVIVFSGLGAGELALPVRLPAAPSNQRALDHYLANPEAWHKVDLVRRRDPNAMGGWRYEAHLMVLTTPYASPSTIARRAKAARETANRSSGIDVNVSNVTVASHAEGTDLRITRIERDAGEKEAAKRRARKDRRRSRGLDRSRRAANPEQYLLSPRQEARARTRAAQGLPPVKVIPKGPRKSRASGKPERAYWKDHLSKSYRMERAAQAAEAAAATRRQKDLARARAGRLTLEHGFRAVIEDGNLSAWARLWGRSLHAFSPGMLVAAIESEVRAISSVAGQLLRASTTTTALSQHCLCGARVKKSLGERAHRCQACGLVADRDAMSAVLAAVVRFGDPAIPSTAFIDAERAARLDTAESRATLAKTLDFVAPRGRQDAPSESTASASDGSSVGETGRTSLAADVMARQNVGMAPSTTPDETDSRSRTKPERARTRTNLPDGGRDSPPLRDSS